MAGTNGKGSTCALLSNFLSEAGYKVGLFTSPDFLSPRERISIGRVPISAGEFFRTGQGVYKALLKRPAIRLTYFEFLTVMAFGYFDRQRVDFAVVETGMGGRLDATNVVRPLCSIITSIGLDHTEWLGNSLEAISREKAAIIKPGAPAVSATILAPVRKRARACAVNLHTPSFGRDWRWKPPDRLDWKGHTYRIGTPGECYAQNAALALEALHAVRLHLPEEAVRTALADFRMRGRCESVRLGKQDIILDIAHNPDALAALGSSLKSLPGRGRFVVVFGQAKSKDARASVSELRRWAASVVFTLPGDSSRFHAPNHLGDLAQSQNLPHRVEPNFDLALGTALRTAGPRGRVVVTGSHACVANIYKRLGRTSS